MVLHLFVVVLCVFVVGLSLCRGFAPIHGDFVFPGSRLMDLMEEMFTVTSYSGFGAGSPGLVKGSPVQ